MNARKLIQFLRSPAGLLILFVGGIAFLVFMMHSCGMMTPPKNTQANNNNNNQLQDILSKLQTGIPEANFPANKPTPTPAPVVEAQQRAQEQKVKEVPPLTLYEAAQPVTYLSKHYAPYGRLIKCQLVITVDSSSIETPVIGMVTEDVYHNGQLVIPAGTEVHGTAQKSHARDRIGSGDDWVLVFRKSGDGFRNGQEMEVKGVALDMEEVQDGEKWAITDGSAGLKGDVLKTDNWAEIKLFAATLVSGLAAGAQNQTIAPATGAIISKSSVTNAFSQGASAVATKYADMILDQIEKDGYYVRVPAGKQFYLYVTETIDQKNARIGAKISTNENQGNNPPSQEPTNTGGNTPNGYNAGMENQLGVQGNFNNGNSGNNAFGGTNSGSANGQIR
jgi:hypothetical protein